MYTEITFSAHIYICSDSCVHICILWMCQYIGVLGVLEQKNSRENTLQLLSEALLCKPVSRVIFPELIHVYIRKFHEGAPVIPKLCAMRKRLVCYKKEVK